MLLLIFQAPNFSNLPSIWHLRVLFLGILGLSIFENVLFDHAGVSMLQNDSQICSEICYTSSTIITQQNTLLLLWLVPIPLYLRLPKSFLFFLMTLPSGMGV